MLCNDQREKLQKAIIILNIYKPTSRTSKYLKQKLIEQRRVMDKSTIIAEALTLLSILIGHVDS